MHSDVKAAAAALFSNAKFMSDHKVHVTQCSPEEMNTFFVEGASLTSSSDLSLTSSNSLQMMNPVTTMSHHLPNQSSIYPASLLTNPLLTGSNNLAPNFAAHFGSNLGGGGNFLTSSVMAPSGAFSTGAFVATSTPPSSPPEQNCNFTTISPFSFGTGLLSFIFFLAIIIIILSLSLILITNHCMKL